MPWDSSGGITGAFQPLTTWRGRDKAALLAAAFPPSRLCPSWAGLKRAGRSRAEPSAPGHGDVSGSPGWLNGFGVSCTCKDKLRVGCILETEPKTPPKGAVPRIYEGMKNRTWEVDGAGLKTFMVGVTPPSQFPAVGNVRDEGMDDIRAEEQGLVRAVPALRAPRGSGVTLGWRMQPVPHSQHCWNTGRAPRGASTGWEPPEWRSRKGCALSQGKRRVWSRAWPWVNRAPEGRDIRERGSWAGGPSLVQMEQCLSW